MTSAGNIVIEIARAMSTLTGAGTLLSPTSGRMAMSVLKRTSTAKNVSISSALRARIAR